MGFYTAGMIGSSGGGGTVSSVGLALPASLFTVSGSPVVGAGTLTGSFANQNPNVFLGGPTSGAPATPTLRTLVLADLPAVVDSAVAAAGVTVSAATGNVTFAVDQSAAFTPNWLGNHQFSALVGHGIVPTYGLHTYGNRTYHRQISAPTGATATPNGTPGTTRADYAIYAKDQQGNTSLCAYATTKTANATIDGTNSVTVAWTAPTPAVVGVTYDVLRIVAGGTPSSVGSISLGQSGVTFTDTGGAASAYTRPTRNPSADWYGDSTIALGATTPQPYGVYVAGGGAKFLGVASPSGLTITPQGTTGATTVGYHVYAYDRAGNLTGAVGQSTSTANATPTNTNFNRIVFTVNAPAAACQLFRTSGSGNWATLGSVSPILPPGTYTIDDSGQALLTEPNPNAVEINSTADVVIGGIAGASGTPGTLSINSISKNKWQGNGQFATPITLTSRDGSSIMLKIFETAITFTGDTWINTNIDFQFNAVAISSTFNNTKLFTAAIPARELFLYESASIGGSVSLEASATSLYVKGGQFAIVKVGATAAPTLVVNGTPGASTVTYYSVTKDRAGNELAKSATVTTNTANATLSSTNSITVTTTAIYGAYSADIIRSVGGPSQGKIGTVTLLGTGTAALIDTGGAASAYTDPTRDASADANFGGGIIHTGDRLGLFSAAAVAQQTAAGVTAGFTPNASANAVFNESTWTGNIGATAYTISDVIAALKTYGALTN